MKIHLILIAFAVVSVKVIYGQQPVNFVNIVDIIPKNISNSENAIILNFIEGSYGQSKNQPEWSVVSNKLSTDIGRLGIGINVILDGKAFDIPEIKIEFFKKLNEFKNAHIFNIVVMCGNRNGKDFCTYIIMIGKYNGQETLYDSCENIYKITAFDYDKLIGIFEKNLKKQNLLRSTPKNNQPVVLTLEALSNTQIQETLPDDIKSKSIVILRSEPFEIPSPLPKCASAMLAKQMEMSNTVVTEYNRDFSELMSKYKGEYKFIAFNDIGEYYEKENVFLLNCMASTDTEISHKIYKKGTYQEVVAEGRDTHRQTQLNIIRKYYIYLKDLKSGERYFMNLTDGKDTWQDCVREFVNNTNK